jgi:hypothetical protein
MATGALVHALCDAAEFLGPMGKEQLERVGPEAVELVREESVYDAG